MTSSIRSLLGCGNIARLTKAIFIAKMSDTFGGAGLYWCEYEGIRFFVKIAPYQFLAWDAHKPTPPELGLMDPVEAEINILRALKTRVIDRGMTPHVIEILAYYNCDNVQSLIKDKPLCENRIFERADIDNSPESALCLFNEMITRGIARDRVALIFSEICEQPLPSFVQQSLPAQPLAREELISSIIFQVYYTLAAIRSVWAGFSHGDLGNLENIMIKFSTEPQYATAARCLRFLRYKVGDKVFDIPFYGFFIKIIDFGHSAIPEEGIVSAVEQNRKERAADFVPDWIDFITMFEKEAGYYPANASSPFPIFLDLNPNRVRFLSALRMIQSAITKTPTPESALSGRVFDRFLSKSDSEHHIIATYSYAS